MAISMFTIIPLPYYIWNDKGVRHILKFYSVIGFIIGLFWYSLYIILFYLKTPIMIFTATIMIFPFILTGMLHLDGYMDVCDALFSRREKSEKIRILKDPNVGAFSVISLCFLFIINFSSVYTFIYYNKNALYLLFIPIISRSLISIFLLTKKSMPQSNLVSYFQRDITKDDKIICIVVFLILCVLVLLKLNIFFLVSMIFSISLCINYCCKQFDGISGDICGFSLVVCETIAIFITSLI